MAQLEYRRQLKRPGRKRLDELKDAVAQVAKTTGKKLDMGVVTFAGCGGVSDLGNYSADWRSRMVEKVRQLKADGGTPAAQALKVALKKASQREGSRVVFVTDGRESCHGDPCAVARRYPDIRIDIISMGGGGILSCVTQSNGGKLIETSENLNIQDILLELGTQSSRAECK